MLLDTEPEVSVVGEVFLPQFVLLDLESTLKDLLSLGSPDKKIITKIFNYKKLKLI